MVRTLYFITHPNVLILPDVAITEWPLSEAGLARMRRGSMLPWVREVTSIYSSTERKAVDGAQVLAGRLALPVEQLAGLGEIDRSATGYLPPAEFEAVADEFFARPDISVRGWERAVDAQSRIVEAVERLLAADRSDRAIAIVSHGAVGTLLWCRLTGNPIDRRYDQPANGGGNFFHFSLAPTAVHSGWTAIDSPGIAASA